MRIFVINPPAVDNVRIVREGRCMQRQEAWGTSWAPLSLATIASVLREAGFDVTLLDCTNDGISRDRFGEEILKRQPSIVVVNTSTPSIRNDLAESGFIKKIDSRVKVIFFGIHVSALPEESLNENSDAEFLAVGEPEYTIRDFAVAIRDGRDIGGVKGLAMRKDGRTVFTSPRPLIGDLDELPFPAWDLVNIKGYRLPITDRPFLLVLTGRGCPYPCRFCAASVFYGKKPRLRSPERIVAEMKYSREMFGIRDFLFWSENSIADREQMYGISGLLAKKLPDARWVCNGRVDMIDEDLLRGMKKGGCWMIGYGIEAGTQRVLDLMKKNIKLENIEKAVKVTRKIGIEVTGHVIVGFPGETEEDILATSRLVKKLDLDYIQVYCSVPFPGSPIYSEAKEAGYINTPDWAMFEQNFSVLDTPWLRASRVMELREKIVRDFYLNPRKILKTAAKVRNPREAGFLFRFAADYFRSWVGKR